MGVNKSLNSQVPLGQQTNSKMMPKSGFHKVKRFIRSLWATRLTEEIQGNDELSTKTAIRELIVYLIFLIIVCFVTFGMTSSGLYYFSTILQAHFRDAESDDGLTFDGIATMGDFWTFVKGPLLDSLFWTFGNSTRYLNKTGYILYENRLLGAARLRQVRIKNNNCVVADELKNHVCFSSYATGMEDKKPFGAYDDSNLTAWVYKTQKELDGSSHRGLISSYDGGGYAQNLAQERTESESILKELMDNLWLDRSTRAVFIDYTLYNPNINIFAVVRFLIEFPATGGVLPSSNFRAVKLLRYVTSWDYFILACECIFALFVFYYIVEEILEVKKQRLKYFISFWNIVDMLILAIAVCIICFNVYRSIEVHNKLDVLFQNPDQYADFDFLAYWQLVLNNASAVMVFVVWIKLFKYMNFNKILIQLSTTLERSAIDLLGFLMMFFTMFLAFAHTGYLIFGEKLQSFSSFDTAIFTLFNIILGDFNFHELEAANKTLGPPFFILYIVLVFFVLLNMFLAILNETYMEVKDDAVKNMTTYSMVDYIKEKYIDLKGKMKQEKMREIKKALSMDNVEQDNKLDFDEWRRVLKKSGYAEAEIDVIFEKYDTGGDRVLNEKAKYDLQVDLRKQNKDTLSDINEKKKEDTEEQQGTKFHEKNEEKAMEKYSSVCLSSVSVQSLASNEISFSEMFQVLCWRVDRIASCIDGVSTKIETVLNKMDELEMDRFWRLKLLSNTIRGVKQYGNSVNERKRKELEDAIREELQIWHGDSESDAGFSVY